MTSASLASSAAPDALDYHDNLIKLFVIAAVFWGFAGFLAGDYIAWQLAFPVLNLDLEWTSFGRLRPLHTSAVVFALILLRKAYGI